MAVLGIRRPRVALALVPGLLLSVPASGAAAADARFAGTARLPGCSGAVVRWPSALDSDPAVVITNGHCVRFPFLGARETLVDEKQWKRIELLDGGGDVATTVRGTRLAYAPCIAPTSPSTSCASRTPTSPRQASPRSPSPRRAVAGRQDQDPVRLLDRAAACTTTGTAYRLHERGWDWQRSIRLPALDGCGSAAATPARPSCPARPARSSASPTPATSVGAGASTRRARRTVAAACVMRSNMNYGQQTWLLTTCIGADRRFDLAVAGCRLPEPRS